MSVFGIKPPKDQKEYEFRQRSLKEAAVFSMSLVIIILFLAAVLSAIGF